MKLLFCIECGAELSKDEGMKYVCANGHPYWNNPRTAAAIFPIKDGKVLLAVRGRQPQRGKYDSIGGFVNPEESIEQAASRELLEETGLTASKFDYIGSVGNTYEENVYACDSLFVITEWTGDMAAADDVASLEWVEPAVIASDAFAWPAHRDVPSLLQAYIDNHGPTT
ncbi:MAG: nucleotide pyrophosphohydrolase [Candidatus Saccharibacteria bacterium]|nr:nucleotide pyrophosphohydrolase [Candidatus Saccharibacteria bacterium]